MNINKLSKFFFSSNSADDVPFRLALVAGQYCGFDLKNEEQTKALLEFLDNEKNYNKEKFEEFLETYIYEDDDDEE